MTSAHPGTTLDNKTLIFDRTVYDPVFVSMYKQGLVEAWYSFVIEKPVGNATSGPGGWFGLGELPPVEYSNDWAIKPIEVTESLPDELTGGKREITLMALTVDGITWNSPSINSSITNSTPFQAVVDTGNHLDLLPTVIAEAINNAFNPPGVFDEELQLFVVECNASTPEFGIILDNHTFWLNSEDLVYRDSGFCYSSISTTAEGSGFAIHFLGEAFLRNVISVFDFGKEEMQFAARVVADHENPPFTNAGIRSSVLSWYIVPLSVAAFCCF